ncbi:MAG TPA: hypothetical protein VMT00_01065 [Thermoanaerobaculia bacterium]|nr:hypothetical protein [Thermoanaerobaculia bacterium]
MLKVRERREFQRLSFEQPLAARIGDADALVIELGIPGAKIAHLVPLAKDASHLISFDWNGETIQLECEVVRSLPMEMAPGYQSGLRFLRALGFSDVKLRALLFFELTRLLEEHSPAPLSPIHAPPEIDGDRTVRGKDAGFVTYRLEVGEWKRRIALIPEQPENGFTIARGFDGQEVKEVCDIYEAADAEGRRLIRLFAELSISEAMGIPPRQVER